MKEPEQLSNSTIIKITKNKKAVSKLLNEIRQLYDLKENPNEQYLTYFTSLSEGTVTDFNKLSIYLMQSLTVNYKICCVGFCR